MQTNRVNAQKIQVKQGMEVGEKQQAIGNMVVAFTPVWPDMGSLDYVEQGASGYLAGCFVSFDKRLSKFSLSSPDQYAPDGSVAIVAAPRSPSSILIILLIPITRQGAGGTRGFEFCQRFGRVGPQIHYLSRDIFEADFLD